ncbi:DMT family transporter [Aestuariibius sp. 2305UL40-4]|uniref:DMT family transporter n=1 Tax=Aestuariibius violaceus TaxID=3234132 RepID=UPI00345EC6A5
MEKRDSMDAFGAVSLIGFAALIAFNQVVIAVVNEGLQPVFFAGLRSAGAILLIWLWMRFRRIPVMITRETIMPGLAIGAVFALEFVFLFMALDLTTVSRTSVIFYTMPVWLAIAAHFFVPGDRITPVKALGLALALAGTAWAILQRPDSGEVSLAGDLFALGGAICWAAIAFIAKATTLRNVTPHTQLLWQVGVSAPILLLAAPLFGDLVRDLQPIHLWGLAFQIVVVVSAGFLFWLWLLSIYPASGVASFSFLSPVFGVLFGWALLGEEVGPVIFGALALVALGLVLINRPARAQVPQKVA